MPTDRPAILYADDESALREAVTLWLERAGFAVHTAASLGEAKRYISEHDYVGAIIDIWLGDGSGFELYSWIDERHPELASRILFVTGDAVARPGAAQIAQLGYPVLTKPFDLREVEKQVRGWVKPG
ncbi:MAG: cell cycle two-component system response regulator CpdR [Gemmatimonadaceae bacterium]